MSGDVQPRKRKDKKRKKDELSLEEHRGTAATFGEGDVQMHSQHDHGTGGHWCAKIIFFSLLAVLVTLIGLIILENRGLSELEANAVESQYSGILDGWIEDTPDDDHHDEHTLELKHHEDDEDIDENGSENIQEFGDDDDDDDEHEEEFDHDTVDDDEGDDDDGTENDEDEEENVSNQIDDDDDDGDDDDDDDNDDVDGAHEVEHDDYNDSNEEENDEIEELNIKTTENRNTVHGGDDDGDDNDDNEDVDDYDGKEDEQTEELEDDYDGKNDSGDVDDEVSNEINNNDGDKDNVRSVNDDDDDDADDDNDDEEVDQDEQDDEDEEEHEEDHEEEAEAEEEIEKIEKEVTDQEESDSAELPLPDVSIEKEEEASAEAVNPDDEYELEDKTFLEVDDLDEPAVERIAPPPPGKPYVEIEDEVSSETPPDTLAEEEEYEKQQEELRQQEAQSTHMWLKLAVGGALLAATHAVIRRATAPRDTPETEQDEHGSREETPLSDRRMTLIPEETSKVIPHQSSRPKVEEEIVPKVLPVVEAAVPKQESEEIEEDVTLDEEVEEDEEVQIKKTDDKNKELYSDDDENEAEEDVDDEEEVEEKKELPKPILKVPIVEKKPEIEADEVPDDVEIIDDEQIEEEIEEEVEDEEEISDVDDAELLSRLEAKYGRLPEPERPGQKHKDGGNSLEDDWPGEPSDPFWREQLEKAEQELRQGAFGACEERAGVEGLAGSGRARWLRARALDQLAEARRDNRILARAIAAYMKLLEMNERLSDKKLLEVALRTIDRIQFRGTYINAEPVYKVLIRRFPNDVSYRNNLTISFLMANRADLASEVLKETLRLWPNDRVALAHYGFVLKTEQNKLEEAVTYFQKALEGDAGAANEPRFYYHLGDALLMLGRKEEAHEVHKRGAALGHFLSPSQRSLYNVPRLKSHPWWDVEATPYAKLARDLERSWRDILKEGEAAKTLYEKEKEGLRERGEWSQLDLFVRGREVPGRCARAPVTCQIVKTEPAAQCRRGQVKFSLLSSGSHVRAHVGPTNCRLRMHLALSNTDHTYIRVDQEIRQWHVGKVLMFDDSFEHEVWHNGTGARLVLIVDVWHPDLTPRERHTLPAI